MRMPLSSFTPSLSLRGSKAPFRYSRLAMARRDRDYVAPLPCDAESFRTHLGSSGVPRWSFPRGPRAELARHGCLLKLVPRSRPRIEAKKEGKRGWFIKQNQIKNNNKIRTHGIVQYFEISRVFEHISAVPHMALEHIIVHLDPSTKAPRRNTICTQTRAPRQDFFNASYIYLPF